MKKFVFIFCVLLSTKIFGQVSRIEILLFKSDTTVVDYFNSLNSLKPNPSFKIERRATSNGDLFLSCMFWGADESFFKCLAITAKFDRIEGREYCVEQSVMGSEEYANYHLTYIKDHFANISPGIWEKVLEPDNKLKIIATFKKISQSNSLFDIQYTIQDNK